MKERTHLAEGALLSDFQEVELFTVLGLSSMELVHLLDEILPALSQPF